MKGLIYLFILSLAPITPTIGKEIGPITLECKKKAPMQSENSPVALIHINPQKHQVEVDNEILPIATISGDFVTWVQASDLAFQFFVWNNFNKEMHSWFARPWDDYMTGRWERRGIHLRWTCSPS